MENLISLFGSATIVAVAAPAQATTPADNKPYAAAIYSRVITEGIERVEPIPADTYTRIVIEPVSDPKKDAALPYLKRNVFFRATLGKRYLNSAILKVAAGGYSSTVTLLTIDHQSSSKKGETFSRSVMGRGLNYPLFLVRGDTGSDVASFSMEANASDDNDSAGASLALKAAQRLVEAVAPESTVVTTLTSEKAKNFSTAVDNAFDRIFASSISEVHPFDLRFSEGKRVRVEIYIPCIEGRWNLEGATPESLPKNCKALAEGERQLLVGSWNIGFDAPRPSLFSNIRIKGTGNASATDDQISTTRKAAVDDARTRPTAILGFKLVEGLQNLGTVASILRQQSWWTETLTQAQTALAAKPASTPPEIVTFCQRIRGAVVAIGLSNLDAQLVSYAVSQSDMVSPTMGMKMVAEPNCRPPTSNSTG